MVLSPELFRSPRAGASGMMEMTPARVAIASQVVSNNCLLSYSKLSEDGSPGHGRAARARA
jgi:hypothetical protein